MNQKLLLCILDGWGVRESTENNAIAAANTPNFDRFLNEYPNSLLGTSGLDVGLPDGQMGNSEVGHMNIGGGRVVMQSLPKIDSAIYNGDLKSKISNSLKDFKISGKACHLMGLLSDGGVHAHSEHIIAMAKILSAIGIKTHLHIFTDGRDTPPQTAIDFIRQLEDEIANLSDVQIATISGRYYAMDRDNRWERVKFAYDAIVNGEAEDKFKDSSEAIKASYNSEIYDEFITPCLIGNYRGADDGDAIIMANFRSDRVREILSAFIIPCFEDFERGNEIKFSSKIGMVKYSDDLEEHIDTLFPADKLENTLGQVVSEAGLKQLRIAETEKYAHITFFFNGGIEEVFAGEQRILVQSPDVATYDLKPEMSAFEVCDKLQEAIESSEYSLIVVNFANTDMVGHTGIMEAAVNAVEAVDICIGKLEESCKKTDTVMLVTADHGNAEQMVDENGEPHTQHTIGSVPFILVNMSENHKVENGKLCDIAPTAITILGLDQPDEMTGKNLYK